jgi:hypothetical protein
MRLPARALPCALTPRHATARGHAYDDKETVLGRFVGLTFTDAREGKDDEYNEWYDKDHLDDMLAAKEITRARRYRAVETSRGIQSSHKYVTIYEIEADDLKEARRAIAAAGAEGTSGARMPEVVDMDKGVALWFFEEITDRDNT